ncbi:MAG: NUDIX hydrolase [Ruminococcaceae bacterium]|nr:NUDIX hydrolase [Oscillospiraceae bacterium]
MDLTSRNFDDNTIIERKISSDPVFDGCVIKVFRDTVSLPNGNTATREVVRHNGAACIVAITDNEEILTVRQYRYALGRITLEIPAGKIDPGESPDTCAIRELAEETGFTAEKLTYIGELHTSVGFCDEVIHMYIATGLVHHELSPDEDEFLTLSAIPMEKLEEMILAGEITDSKTISAVLKACALYRRGEL